MLQITCKMNFFFFMFWRWRSFPFYYLLTFLPKGGCSITKQIDSFVAMFVLFSVLPKLRIQSAVWSNVSLSEQKQIIIYQLIVRMI